MGDGLKDSYSYHSMSGGWSGEEAPGDKLEESAKEEEPCEECKEYKKSTAERTGDLEGEFLCSDCVEEKQRKKEEREKKAVLDKIRGDPEED